MASTWDILAAKLISNAKENEKLLTATFELTARCNLQCKMCYLRHAANDRQAKEKELTTEQWIRLAEEARDEGMLLLTLTGGEVLLREDFKILYEKLMNMGFLINILTNGTLIDKKFVDWIATIPPMRISMTLYGASPETYKNVTGFAGGYDRVMHAVDYLMEKGIPIQLKTTMVKGNIDDFDQLHDYAIEKTGVLGVVNYISPSREGCLTDPAGNRLNPKELSQFEAYMSERNRRIVAEMKKNMNLTRIEDGVAEFEQKMIEEIPSSKKKNSAFTCPSGTCSAWVTWNGTLTPCGLMEKPETYPLLHGFKSAWEELKKKCMAVPECHDCLKCEMKAYCEKCPARRLRETGYFDQAPAYLCQLAQERKELISNYRAVEL